MSRHDGYWETNPAEVERARLMWEQGLSASTIGRALGCTKNALLGLKNRQGWPHRGPAILPPRALKDGAPKPVVRTHQCRFLDGDKPFLRCTEAAEPGYPYCRAHAKRAYINWRGADAGAAA